MNTSASRKSQCVSILAAVASVVAVALADSGGGGSNQIACYASNLQSCANEWLNRGRKCTNGSNITSCPDVQIGADANYHHQRAANAGEAGKKLWINQMVEVRILFRSCVGEPGQQVCTDLGTELRSCLGKEPFGAPCTGPAPL